MNKVYDTDNTIDVFFEHNQPNKVCNPSLAKAPHHTYVTNISPTVKEQLFRALAPEHSLSDSCCIECFSMQYNERFVFDGGKTCSLTINPLWSHKSSKPLACEKMQSLFGSRMDQCACNLRAGKCRDAFMRRTVGAILFPELYAKQK